MTDQTNTPDEENAQSPLDELKLLKARAKLMGIPLGGCIGVKALRKKIATAQAAETNTSQEAEDEDNDSGIPEVVEIVAKPVPVATARKPPTGDVARGSQRGLTKTVLFGNLVERDSGDMRGGWTVEP